MSLSQTRDDKKVKAALSMREVAQQLGGFDIAIEKALALLSNPMTESERQDVSKTLTDLRNALHNSVAFVKSNDKFLDPIPALDYVHNRNKTKKKAVLQDITNKRPAPPVVSTLVAPQAKRSKTVVPDIVLPAPSTGALYSRKELILVVSAHPKGTTARRCPIKKILEQNLVPCKERMVHNLLKSFEVDCVPIDDLKRPWGQTGRRPLLNEDGMQSITKNLQRNNKFCLNKDKLHEAMTQQNEKRMLERGFMPLTETATAPSKQSVVNYKSFIGSQEDISITRTAVVKSDTCYTAENSLRSAMSFILTTAATHLIPCSKRLPDVYKEVADNSKTSESSRSLFYMVSDAHNDRPLFPIRRPYITSTDDTSTFIVKGESPVGSDPHCKGDFLLVSSNGLKTNGTRSKFTTGPAEKMTGLRVKLTHTFAANGEMAPLFVSVCGFTEDELPSVDCPSGVLVMKVKHLGLHGGTGTVAFIRNDKDQQTDKVRCRTYRDRIFIPFIERQRFLNDGWETGKPIDDTMTAVSWCDGDMPQIDTIVNESLELYKNLKIIGSKQSAARSATEQVADLARVFKQQHAIKRASTAENVHWSSHPMKRIVHQGFADMKSKGLKLSVINSNALMNFLACIPETLTLAGRRRNIVHGFVANGMVSDEKLFKSPKFAFPDFKAMLSTTRRDVSIQEFLLCQSTFPELFRLQLKNGDVSEDDYVRLGYPIDLDPTGEEVPKTATMKQETRQRAKCITHPTQRERKLMMAELLIAAKKRKHAKIASQCEKLMEENAKCEATIEKLMEENAKHEATIGDKEPTLEILAGCTAPCLKAFIHARHFKTMDGPTKDSDWKWPKKKGKLEEAKAGEDNLIKRAHECCTQQVILERPSETVIVPPTPNTRHENATVIVASPEQIRFSGEEKASSFLEDAAWLVKVHSSFDPFSRCKMLEVNDEVKNRADALQVQLVTRLNNHCNLKIQQEHKRDHWSLQWAALNIPPVAAILVLMDHIKPDPGLLSSNDCLLKSAGNFRRVMGIAKGLRGCYLYWDSNNECWVRSGSAAGASSNFDVRHKAHEKGSMLLKSKDLNSKFYTTYPSENATIEVKPGLFEKLQQFVGVGYQPIKAKPVSLDYKTQQGIFHFDAETNQKIGNLKSMGSRLVDKQQHLVSYLLELAYDLCLDPEKNVSGNPGFESVLGVFNNAEELAS